MKESFFSEIKETIAQSKQWVTLEVEYAKLTVAEKFTVLLSSLLIAAVCLLFGMVVLIMLAFSLAELFKLMMSPALAYLSSAGCIVVLVAVFYLCRRPLLLNPLSRLITKVIFH